MMTNERMEAWRERIDDARIVVSYRPIGPNEITPEPGPGVNRETI